jgi:hypothetical protein
MLRRHQKVQHIDNPGGDDHGYYRIGWELTTRGAIGP